MCAVSAMARAWSRLTRMYEAEMSSSSSPPVTIPLSAAARACAKIKVLSVAGLIGEAIRRTHDEESISSLFV